MTKNKRSSTDEPIFFREDDLFSVLPYVDGLIEFIQTCNTPMTIAIQGDWGTGKTSIMNMSKHLLEEKNEVFWFNTWQYSQFKMEESLSISFLTMLVKKIEEKNQKSSYRENLEKLNKIVKKLGSLALFTSSFLNPVATRMAEKALENYSEESQLHDISQVIADLKTCFEDAVGELLKNMGREGEDSRIIIFIDDLDRLNPATAVELLEVLKIFFDVKKCVFVLAVDYEVILKGVADKYGENLSKEKGRQFFDKLIQLPFKVPYHNYEIKKFVIDQLERYDISGDEQVDVFLKILNLSIGSNPRSMKRLFNTFDLIRKIFLIQNKSIRINDQLLFAILCMQLAFEDLYTYLIEMDINDFCNEEFEESPVNLENDQLEKLMEEKIYDGDKNDSEKEKEMMRATAFVLELKNLINKNENGRKNFFNILKLSSITNQSEEKRKNMSEKEKYNNNLRKGSDETRELFEIVQGKIQDIDSQIEEVANQEVITYKYNKKTIVDIKIQKARLNIYLNLKKDNQGERLDVMNIENIEDVSNKGRHGTGSYLYKLAPENEEAIEEVVDLIKKSYEEKLKLVAKKLLF